FDETLYPRLARLDGVAAASPEVEQRASPPGAPAVTLIGVDVLRAGQVTPSLSGGASGAPATGAFGVDTALLSPALMAATGA
ncbi:hypothetical protein, partial [Priestia megaterium]|uniref:hypothetical protein n=1 Tax=Priestia megaterium TaxID=1404 RepID=UPI0035B65CAE